ncbi:MAG: hypothetical protein RL215_1764 [Planctomycetota bacterium]
MALSADKLEEVVRQVLQELRASQGALAAVSAVRTESRPSDGSAYDSGSDSGSADVLRISERAVTELVLATAGAAGRTVSLDRGAVLTPSARDYIRRHGVRVASHIGGAGSSLVASVSGVVVIVGRESTVRLAASAVGWTVREVADEFLAVSAVREHLPGRRVLCVCADASIPACLLNRDPGLRAAVLAKSGGMERLLERMQPQVVCLQPAGWSYMELQRLLVLMQRPLQQPGGWVEQQLGGAVR